MSRILFIFIIVMAPFVFAGPKQSQQQIDAELKLGQEIYHLMEETAKILNSPTGLTGSALKWKNNLKNTKDRLYFDTLTRGPLLDKGLRAIPYVGGLTVLNDKKLPVVTIGVISLKPLIFKNSKGKLVELKQNNMVDSVAQNSWLSFLIESSHASEDAAAIEKRVLFLAAITHDNYKLDPNKLNAEWKSLYYDKTLSFVKELGLEPQIQCGQDQVTVNVKKGNANTQLIFTDGFRDRLACPIPKEDKEARENSWLLKFATKETTSNFGYCAWSVDYEKESNNQNLSAELKKSLSNKVNYININSFKVAVKDGKCEADFGDEPVLTLEQMREVKKYLPQVCGNFQKEIQESTVRQKNQEKGSKEVQEMISLLEKNSRILMNTLYYMSQCCSSNNCRSAADDAGIELRPATTEQ